MYDKYLVTGATGFLGRAVAEELVLVMCAIKAHCQTSSRMPTAVPV